MTYLIAPSLIEGGMFFAARQQHRAVCSFHAGAKVCLSFRASCICLLICKHLCSHIMSFFPAFSQYLSLPLYPTHSLFISDFIFLSLTMSSFTRFLSLSLSLSLSSLSLFLSLSLSLSLHAKRDTLDMIAKCYKYANYAKATEMQKFIVQCRL